MNPIPITEQQPFTYIVNSVAMAANAADQQLLIFGFDSDFDFYTITAATSVDTTAAIIANNFTLQLKDVTSGRDFSTGPVQRFNLAGVIPTNVLGGPRCIRFGRKQQIQFNFLNLTANPLTVQVALTGYKVFTRGL